MNFNPGKYGDFLISTTSSLENYQILQYFDLVSSRVVVGAGFLTEFFAGLTDTFGGRSQSVEDRLDELYSTAINKLVETAKKLGANAIVGVKVDIDEISGKGTFMFMATAIGTPVYAIRNEGCPLAREFFEAEKVAKKVAEEAEKQAAKEAKERAALEAAEKAHQRAVYWESHPEEKTLLEQEKEEIKLKLDILYNHPGDRERAEIFKQIRELREKTYSLGWRDGKEKQALESQIDDLREKATQLDKKINSEKAELRIQLTPLKERLKQIEAELNG